MNAPAEAAGAAWHLVHTAREDKAAAAAIKRVVGEAAIYRPVMRVQRRKARLALSRAQRRQANAGRVFYRDCEVALYPRYLFVRFDPASGVWFDVMRRVGFEGLACLGARPGRVPDALVAHLRGLEVGGVIPGATPARALPFALGAKVRIVDGAFAGFAGEVAALDESARIGLLISCFGRRVRISLYAAQIETL